MTGKAIIFEVYHPLILCSGLIGKLFEMPKYGGISIGIANEKKLREDLDWHDTINGTWLTKWNPKKDLSFKFQSRLKIRGTFLNLADLKSDIETLKNSDFVSLKESFNEKMEQEREGNFIGF